MSKTEKKIMFSLLLHKEYSFSMHDGKRVMKALKEIYHSMPVHFTREMGAYKVVVNDYDDSELEELRKNSSSIYLMITAKII